VSTYESEFLEGFRRWRGSILSTQRSPEKDPAAYQNTAVFQIGVNTKFL